MKYYTLLSAFCLLFNSLQAQLTCKLNGTITDSEGKPIPYASIYIPELSKGSMANIEGDFTVIVPCGEYEIQFQSLGYEKKALSVNLASENELPVSLKQISYQIREVSVDPSQEDPAYNYIRKATAMAEYYKDQIVAYNCKLYVRSFYDPDKIPWIAKKLADEEDLREMQIGDITETVVEFSYKKPNQVKEKILASKSGRQDSLKFGSGYINLDFYNLGGTSIINPLSRNAFKVYEFEHINSYYDGTNRIHKIKIIPKRKGNDLMSGFIHINDGIWNIKNVDVEFDQPLAKFKYQQLYNEVENGVWMPTNHKIKVRISLLGFEMDVNYLATLSNLEVTTDPLVDEKIKATVNLRTEANPNNSEITKQQAIDRSNLSKTEKRIDDLINKESLSKVDGIKLVRLIKKQEREEERKSDSTKSLEVQNHREIEYGENAFSSNDSIFNQERDVPLSETEQKIYVQRDSLEKIKSGDSTAQVETSKIEKFIYFNGTVKSKNKNIRFQPKGLLAGVDGWYNTVDGFLIRKELFTYEWNNNKGNLYKFNPFVGYAPARKTFTGKIEYESQYNKDQRAGFFGAVGRETEDFSRENPMTKFGNTITSLFFKENYKKYYQADYFKFGHQFDIVNGLQLVTYFDYQDRIGLRNYTDKTFSKADKEFTPNIPDNIYVESNMSLLNDNKAVNVDATISYTPEQFYKTTPSKKEMLQSKYPTFSLNYRQGIEGIFNSQTDYQFASFSINHNTHLGLIDAFKYNISVGKFLNSDKAYFADYKNFNAQPSLIIGNYLNNSFKLMPNYKFSTNDYYFEGHAILEDNNLLLKRLPFMRNNLMKESFELHYLITEQNINYTEFGYSLNNIFFFMNAGVYVSFEDDQFEQVGFRIGFNLPTED